MLVRVKYTYSDNGALENDWVVVDAEIDRSTPDSEIDKVLKPLIKAETGHQDIKILNLVEA
ncbi:hypothetical protein M3603_08450 [Rummeliibacillus stabekisii]|uniref:hypothetical protein n=1 Tax=Rummeliibacillus stabekisii TaxID=241244 RepID=UPI00203E27F8|nr:hypothetical protein [Rummeliibacillus stabekisii]MCM3316707.1 hypothetical protein [Rummeliibacillus stabekisii]